MNIIPYSQDEYEQIQHLREQYSCNNYVRSIPACCNTTSYTLRNNFQEALQTERFFTNTLEILSLLYPTLRNIVIDLFHIVDRSGLDHNTDPLADALGIHLAYIPKGLTEFKPDKTYNDELSGTIRRNILKANAGDPECPESDKSITIKVYEGPNYLHIYFNKYSVNTLKRLILIALEKGITKFVNLNNREEFPDEIITIIPILLTATPDSANTLIEIFTNILKNRLTNLNKNLVNEFSATLQTSLSSNRKESLAYTARNAERYYNDTLESLSSYANNLKNAQQALSDYEEANYSAIKVFLEKIKNYPNTKEFGLINENNLQFIIEEPLIYTEDKIWSKYITNSSSNVRCAINTFAENYYLQYNTTKDILDFCIQRLFKEILVDQTLKLFTSSAMYLDKQSTSFRINKNTLPDAYNLFPHPHLGTNSITCWGNAMTEITKAIQTDNGEIAFQQMIYAFEQMSAADNVITDILTNSLLNTKYHERTIFQKPNTTERTTFENIIKEFIADETNKINTPSTTSSETSI